MTPARRRLRDELLVHPYELPIVVCTLAVAIVFTIFPEVLSHSPVSFETRGVIHHAWHYALLLGAASNLTGRIIDGFRGLALQGIGLALLLCCLALNLTALVAGEIDGTAATPLGGLDIALRIALMFGLGVRLWIILKRPTVPLKTVRDAS